MLSNSVKTWYGITFCESKGFAFFLLTSSLMVAQFCLIRIAGRQKVLQLYRLTSSLFKRSYFVPSLIGFNWKHLLEMSFSKKSNEWVVRYHDNSMKYQAFSSSSGTENLCWHNILETDNEFVNPSYQNLFKLPL